MQKFKVALLVVVVILVAGLTMGCEYNGFRVPGTQVLTVEVEGEGTVQVDGSEVEDRGTSMHDEFDLVSLDAEPAAGGEFIGWEGDVENQESESTWIIMDEDQQVTATFAD